MSHSLCKAGADTDKQNLQYELVHHQADAHHLGDGPHQEQAAEPCQRPHLEMKPQSVKQ